jgi:hypothetical protein
MPHGHGHGHRAEVCGQGSSSRDVWESDRSVEMGLIGSAVLTFCHEAASRCRMRPREAIHQCHAWSRLRDVGSDVPSARAPDCGK